MGVVFPNGPRYNIVFLDLRSTSDRNQVLVDATVVGGTKEPLFVIGTDTVENIIYVGEGNKHPGLFRSALKIEPNDIHWLRSDLILDDEQQMKVKVRIRYRQPLQEATLIKKSDGLYIDFEQSQSAITSGQFAAWYSEDELLGSGVIS